MADIEIFKCQWIHPGKKMLVMWESKGRRKFFEVTILKQKTTPKKPDCREVWGGGGIQQFKVFSKTLIFLATTLLKA